MKNFIIKRWHYAIIYTILLFLFTIFVLLDTFLIPKEEIVLSSNQTVIGSNIEIENNINDDEIIPVSTDTSYLDKNISINISTIREYDSDIYVADIFIKDMNYFKAGFANKTAGRNIKEKVSKIASSYNALLAINGDFYGFRDKGIIIRNGILYRNTSRGKTAETLLIYADGTFKGVKEDSVNGINLINDKVYHSFSFGPILVNNYEIPSTLNTYWQANIKNPRTAICILEKNHYLFVVSDGRTNKSKGLSIKELGSVMHDLNCNIAYNLDGGGSSTMYFNGKIVNNPTDGSYTGERRVSDIVYIG